MDESTFREPEPCESKGSSTVLRGQGRSNPPELPDKKEMTEDKLKEKYMIAIAQIAHLVFCRHTKSKQKNQKSYFLPSLKELALHL